jgi:hypothetical protein
MQIKVPRYRWWWWIMLPVAAVVGLVISQPGVRTEQEKRGPRRPFYDILPRVGSTIQEAQRIVGQPMHKQKLDSHREIWSWSRKYGPKDWDSLIIIFENGKVSRINPEDWPRPVR